MTPREKKAARLQREADAFNAAHPVGTPVRYWRRPAIRGEDPPSGESVVLQPAVAVPARHHVSVTLAERGVTSIVNVEALTVPLRVAKPRRERSERHQCVGAAQQPAIAERDFTTTGRDPEEQQAAGRPLQQEGGDVE